jgi:proteasome lid subunit RPN8/RPN11
LIHRIDIDESLARLVLPASLWDELTEHALSERPEECCGLIMGDVFERYRRSVRCRNEMTELNRQDPGRYPRDGRAAFHMNPIDYLKAEEEVRASGEWVTAIYHSHVDFGLYLSDMDLDFATSEDCPFPEADQLVLSIRDGQVEGMGMFQRDTGESPFVGRQVGRGGV